MEIFTPHEFPLHVAARNGDHELLTTLLANSRVSKRKSTSHTLTKSTLADLPNTRDEQGFTPLHAAAETGHVHCIKILVKCGAAINAKDQNGRRPIRILTNIYTTTTYPIHFHSISQILRTIQLQFTTHNSQLHHNQIHNLTIYTVQTRLHHTTP